MVALLHPERVSALALYEPTLFALVDAQAPPPNGVDGIRHAAAAALEALKRQDQDEAASHFIDFWMGAGSWAATPPQRKVAIADAVVDMGIGFMRFSLSRHPSRRLPDSTSSSSI
jgi:hypothetical protein